MLKSNRQNSVAAPDAAPYAQIVESSSEAIFTTTLEGFVTYWNGAAAELYGLGAQEMIGRNATALVPSSLVDEYQTLCGRVKSSIRVEPWLTRHRLAQGRTLEVRVAMSALLDADGVPNGIAHFVSPTVSSALVRQALTNHSESLTSITDLSMQLLETSEQARLETESQYRMLLESALDYGLFSLSLEGRVNAWNRGAQRLTGYRAEEIIGQHLEVFSPPEARQIGATRRALETALQSGRYEDQGLRVRENGSQFWAEMMVAVVRDASGRASGYLVVLRDLSEQRELLERQRLLSDSVERNLDCILITDANLEQPGPRILYANPSFERMTGYDLKDVIGKTPRLFQGPDTDLEMLKRLRNALMSKRVFVAETTNYRKDGTSYRVRWQIAPIFDAAGAVSHFVSVQRNVGAQPASQAGLDAFPEIIRILDSTVSNDLLLNSTGLRGRLEDIGGAGSLVQMLSTSHSNGLLIFNDQIRLHLQNGRIVGLEHPHLTGMEAAVSAFALEAGSFEFTALRDQPEAGLSINPLSVALEAARRGDEAQHGAASTEQNTPNTAQTTQGLLTLPTVAVAVTFASSVGLEHFKAELQSDPSWAGQRVVLTGRGFRVVAIGGTLSDLPAQLRRPT